MRSPSPIASFSSLLPGGIRFTKRRRARKKSLTIILRAQTLQQLHERADDAANAQGLTRTDIAYGNFLADHIASSLEAAYLADAARAGAASEGDLPAGDPRGEHDDETAFAAVTLSSTAARKLLAQARKDTYGQGGAADPDPETFMYRRLGQLLEVPYNRCA